MHICSKGKPSNNCMPPKSAWNGTLAVTTEQMQNIRDRDCVCIADWIHFSLLALSITTSYGANPGFSAGKLTYSLAMQGLIGFVAIVAATTNANEFQEFSFPPSPPDLPGVLSKPLWLYFYAPPFNCSLPSFAFPCWCGLDFPLWKTTNYEVIQIVLMQVVANRTSLKALSYRPSLGFM